MDAERVFKCKGVKMNIFIVLFCNLVGHDFDGSKDIVRDVKGLYTQSVNFN